MFMFNMYEYGLIFIWLVMLLVFNFVIGELKAYITKKLYIHSIVFGAMIILFGMVLGKITLIFYPLISIESIVYVGVILLGYVMLLRKSQ